MAAAELAKSQMAKSSGTLTARKPNGLGEPAAGNSPDLGNDVRPDRDSNAGPTA